MKLRIAARLSGKRNRTNRSFVEQWRNEINRRTFILWKVFFDRGIFLNYARQMLSIHIQTHILFFYLSFFRFLSSLAWSLNITRKEWTWCNLGSTWLFLWCNFKIKLCFFVWNCKEKSSSRNIVYLLDSHEHDELVSHLYLEKWKKQRKNEEEKP